jgi:release factor glutamine methyltransferase
LHSQLIFECCFTSEELGSGNGVPITFCSKLIQCALAIATDINPRALSFTRKTATENNVMRLETIQCDLASSLLGRCKGIFDIIIFNPPYVPTPDSEVSGNGIEVSWAGGEKGRQVTDRAIPQIAHLLSEKGVCYMITVDDNEPEDIAQTFKNLGLNMVPLVRRRAYNEYLTVQRISHIV